MINDLILETETKTFEVKDIGMKYIKIDNEGYYKISNSDAMRSFFMSIVSDSNHWMFISSNGGLTAGRKDSENALFPYYTDDKITESYETTGSKSIFMVFHDGKNKVWEPFSDRYTGMYKISRNLYKSAYGNKIIFEEINHDLELAFKYKWSSSDKFGFVKSSTLSNNKDTTVQIKVLDGVQNILPYGVNSNIQVLRSNLVDAYKKSELLTDVGMGIFALSSIIVDRAEPSEALKANIVWSVGLDNPTYLLSSLQLNAFRKGEQIVEEVDVKAEKGAYFISKEIQLKSSEQKQWMIVANVNQGPSAIAEISAKIKNDKNILSQIIDDIKLGNEKLISLTAASDGFQLTADKRKNTRHYSNVLFNIMRGGIYDDNYRIEKWDFTNYIAKANKKVYRKNEDVLESLPDVFLLSELRSLAHQSEDKNFRRLALEYMPLKFSRRHGDPSRPWNKFSINTRSEIDGSKILDYEGNWRDIFQNWEALAHSYPEFIESMIHKFLNATTFEGYNPYRVTKDGFDWEVIEEHDPWSYIGYWGDHQIIYLLKFLEFIQNHSPNKLREYFNKDLFVYANVPYKIKTYAETLKDPKDTIEFDHESDKKIWEKRSELGSDGALLRDENFFIHKVNFIEKMLATILAKMSNFIPEGGIWLNTQRPEWNDANNALVGNGVSMVTLYYLRRFLNFFNEILEGSVEEEIDVSKELIKFFENVSVTLVKHKSLLSGKIDNKERKQILDGLGEAGSEYRTYIYNNAFSGRKDKLSIKDLEQFLEVSLEYLDHSIDANKRDDNMYHAYNLMTLENDQEISISYLSVMLEGQVAALSSGYITPKDCLKLLDGLKNSELFRRDQYSYLLYPNKELPRFTEKNNIPEKAVENSKLFKQLLNDGNGLVIERDINGSYHFNGSFNNATSLKSALDELPAKYKTLIENERDQLLQTFEDVFNHKAFTGRSGTFYGYEGLGSIYWHMVSKLLLAVQECCLRSIELGESEEVKGRLLEHYYEINEGIGVHKSPELYGAFPTDPYSHTPAGKGAQQPGMTGQVKEDILSRFGELGVFVKGGELYFDPCLLRKEEFLKKETTFSYVDVNNAKKEFQLGAGMLCFTYCQIPVVYVLSDKENLKVVLKDGNSHKFESLSLDKENSKKVFQRTGEIEQIIVSLKQHLLK